MVFKVSVVSGPSTSRRSTKLLVQRVTSDLESKIAFATISLPFVRTLIGNIHIDTPWRACVALHNPLEVSTTSLSGFLRDSVDSCALVDGWDSRFASGWSNEWCFSEHLASLQAAGCRHWYVICPHLKQLSHSRNLRESLSMSFHTHDRKVLQSSRACGFEQQQHLLVCGSEDWVASSFIAAWLDALQWPPLIKDIPLPRCSSIILLSGEFAILSSASTNSTRSLKRGVRCVSFVICAARRFQRSGSFGEKCLETFTKVGVLQSSRHGGLWWANRTQTKQQEPKLKYETL